MVTTRTVARLLNDAKSIAVIIHQSPDGDAAGSSIALINALQAAGKNCQLICVNDIPLAFESIVGPVKPLKTLPSEADAYLVLDCSDLGRTGFSKQLKAMAKKGKLIIGIDHHTEATLDKFITHQCGGTKYSATAEIIFHLLEELRSPINTSMATALLLGIYTDTGGFSHPNTSSSTLGLASRLIYAGANLRLINQTFCRQLSLDQQRLWGSIMAELEINELGVVIAQVRSEHFKKTKTSSEDLSGLANQLALIEEAQAALVLIENEEQEWRGILRTRHSHVNIGRLARLLGGRGQKKAAGFTATKSIFSGRI